MSIHGESSVFCVSAIDSDKCKLGYRQKAVPQVFIRC